MLRLFPLLYYGLLVALTSRTEFFKRCSEEALAEAAQAASVMALMRRGRPLGTEILNVTSEQREYNLPEHRGILDVHLVGSTCQIKSGLF